MLFNLRAERAMSSVFVDGKKHEKCLKKKKRGTPCHHALRGRAAPVGRVVIYESIFIIYMRRFLT